MTEELAQLKESLASKEAELDEARIVVEGREAEIQVLGQQRDEIREQQLALRQQYDEELTATYELSADVAALAQVVDRAEKRQARMEALGKIDEPPAPKKRAKGEATPAEEVPEE